VPAQALEPLSDAAMSAVRGRDGVSFDLNGFAMSGDARVSYTTPIGTAVCGKIQCCAQRQSAAVFRPVQTRHRSRRAGLADVNIAFPQNTYAQQRWQMAYDWGITADGVTREQSSVVIKDLVLYGGGLQFTTPQVNDGVAFGAALRMDIGQLSLRPVAARMRKPWCGTASTWVPSMAAACSPTRHGCWPMWRRSRP
jgi:hypothetical protein